MKRLFGKEKDGIIVSAETEAFDGAIELVQNYTDTPDDYMDEEGGRWITVKHLGQLFNDICKKTGMKKQVLATLCGKTTVTFSRYCNGAAAVPFAIWRIVEIEYRKLRGH